MAAFDALGALAGAVVRAASAAGSTPSAASGEVGISMTCAVPPAASIFSRALFVNASASTNSFAETSPWPRTLSGMRSRRTRPAALSVSALTVTGVFFSCWSLPASIAALIAPTFTTSY